MKQVIVIGGGETFDTYGGYLKFLATLQFDPSPKKKKAGWKKNLQADLGKGYKVLYPSMPCALNAKYREWEIYFKNVAPHIKPDAIIIGHSLGGIFIMKYLHEYKLKVKKVILVAPPYGTINNRGSGLDDFNLPLAFDFKIASKSRPKIQIDAEVHLFQSDDDAIVPFTDAHRWKSVMNDINAHVYKKAGHFITQTKIPDLIKIIKS